MVQAKRLICTTMAMLLMLPTMMLPVQAEDAGSPTSDMISVSGDWHGSVFGDVGGQDKITADNFHIVESAANTVAMRAANNRGKIASSSEGIALYYQEVAADRDFTLSATATVKSFDVNNQVSFGLTVRDAVVENLNTKVNLGNYLAVGPINVKDDVAKYTFARTVSTDVYGEESHSQVKPGEMVIESKPAPDRVYDLTIRKVGSTYIVTFGNEEPYVYEDFPFVGDSRYVGLYAARNTEVEFSNVALTVATDPTIGEWAFHRFGSNTGDEKNPAPVIHDDGSVSMIANGGKIASDNEGISFYSREIMPVDANFEISAEVVVDSFAADNNQKSFGLMLRDSLGEHGSSDTTTANYVLVGALDKVMKAAYKQTSQTKLEPFAEAALPGTGEVYDMSIRKSGNTYVVRIGDASETIQADGLFTDSLYAGLYAAREASVTFRNIEVKLDTRKVESVQVDATDMQTVYLIDEALNLEGLEVTANYSDGSSSVLAEGDYIVTGFDSAEAGANWVTVHHNGVTTKLKLTIQALTATELSVQYYPAKTSYYVGDTLDAAGLTVVAAYNDGYKVAEIGEELFTLQIDGVDVTDSYILHEPGTVTVTIRSTETPTTTTSFDLDVIDAEITKLEIRQAPEKTQYFIGEALDVDGLVVYAHYSDNEAVRLQRSDYTVSALDTSESGEQAVMISFKEETVAFTVNVKEKEVTGIQVTQYPQTTYQVGEAFDSDGLVVSKVYDNGDQVVLGNDAFTILAEGYNADTPGEYEVEIVPEDATLDSIILRVTVVEPREVEWKQIRFGQSIKDNQNVIDVRDDGIYVASLDGAGKVTGDHDGITFYYTEIDADAHNFVLSADIQVLQYAKSPHDGQEAFGMMARDAIGTDGDSGVFASNIAAIGGHSGGTKNDNGTQLFIRTGVESSDGAGSKGIQRQMLRNDKPDASNTHPAAPYRLTLAKTNSGYVGQLNDGEEAIFYEPDMLHVQDDKLYVGFFTARVAEIVVSDIDFKVTAAATDPPKVEPPAEPVDPTLTIASLEKTSEADYELIVRTNVDGVVTVKQGQSLLAEDLAVEGGTPLHVPAVLVPDSANHFSVSFLPDDTQYLTSYDRIVRNYTVTMKQYETDGHIYAAPDGSPESDGSAENPLDLDTAIDYVLPGQSIILLDGTYTRDRALDIKKFNRGTPEARKSLVAAPGARPVIDFDRASEGVLLSGDYWHIRGIDFTRSAPNTKGFTVGGDSNIVELCRFYEHGDTGLQISRTDITETREDWPSHNLILNSTSFDNRDPSDNNADGFAAKLTVGEGNVFRGTIAHNNIDDGWDLYTKAGTGAIGAVVIEDSIAYHNGFLTDGTVGAGDKNGFKLGGEGIHVPHVIRNSIAFGNGAAGFTSNSNPGVMVESGIAYDNAGRNLDLSTYDGIEPDFTLNGFVSYQKGEALNDQYPQALASRDNFLFDGTQSVNRLGVALTDDNFASLVPVLPYERDEQGNIVWGEFLKFTAPTGTRRGSGGAGTVVNEELVVVNELQASDGLITVTLSEEEKQVWLPADAVALHRENRLQIVRDDLIVEIPGEVLEALKALVTEDELADAQIAIAMKTVASEQVAELLNKAAERSQAELRAAGAIFDVSLVMIDEDGRRQELEAFPENIKLAFNVHPDRNDALLGVYYIADDGTLEYVGGYMEDDWMAAEVSHFSLYAVLEYDKSFADVPEAHWAAAAIKYAAAKQIAAGVTHTAFAPEREVSRAEFAALLARALGLEEAGAIEFADVDANDWYAAAVAAVSEAGIVSGRSEAVFAPDAAITREEMASMIVRAHRYLQGEAAEAASPVSYYADASSISGWALDDVAAAVELGFMQGRGAQIFVPKGLANRAESVQVIYMLLQ